MEEENPGEEIRESTGHVVLEITPLESAPQKNPITSYIRKELEVISFPCCIYPVPTNLRSRNEEAYEPIMVSIGPIHHGKPHLQRMENHKWKYLNSLLDRNLTLDTTLDSCIRALKDLESEIRACYQGGFSHYSSDKFLTMILLDSTFIIELFLRCGVKGFTPRDDALLKSPKRVKCLRNDLILLENQIPFFVLRRIFSLVPIPKQCEKSISELSLKFFKSLIPKEIHILHQKYNFQGSNHLLDLVWKCYLPTFYKLPLNGGTGSGKEIDSASKLRKSGIKIRRADAESILDVIFLKGKLVIPSLRIHDHTVMVTVFKNMIAWEHCYGEDMKYVTSYAYLMRGLLQTEHDVRLFYRQRIFPDSIKDKAKVVTLFKELCQDVDLERFYYEGMCEELAKYKTRKCHTWYYIMERMSMGEGNEKRPVTLLLIFCVILLCVALFVILYLFFRHERHESRQ